MTQEDKKLLLKDLCARLPYGVMVNAQYKDGEGWKIEDRKLLGLYTDGQVYIDCVYTTIDCIKPYLRPMSSMTEEEKKEWYWLQRNTIHVDCYEEGDEKTIDLPYLEDLIAWLNSHHFDYHGLIEKGLAIGVTKENNPYEIKSRR